MVCGIITASLTMFLIVIDLFTFIVAVREAAGAERVGIAPLQVLDVLSVEL